VTTNCRLPTTDYRQLTTDNKIMGKLFGTDGIRGVAGRYPLDPKTIERIGYQLAKELTLKLDRAPSLIIGRDTRESGEWIEAAIFRGIHAARSGARSAGIITTPGVAYLTRALGADAGIVISASHNPYQDNGIKVFSTSGEKLDDATEQSMERALKDDSSSLPPFVEATVETDPTLPERYLDFLRDEIGVELTLMKIVVDCANGASYRLAPRLFAALGAQLTVINAEPNGRNINLDCGSLHPEKLQQAVVNTGSDLGIAFDGDADRLLMVDEDGQLIDGDQILFVMADYLAASGRLSGNRVVATVMSNLGLELALSQRGIELIRTSVGDKYVLDELLRAGGSIGGEQSGHIIFPQISLAGDGMITALEVLRVLVESNLPMSKLTSGFKRYPQFTINVNVTHKPPFESVPAIREAIAALEQEMDGKGRLLVRYSGTENKARVMIEGQDETTIRRQAEELARIIMEQIG
jgi:phosphoglucosamine mutase